MITIKFFESSDVDEYINNAKAEVEDLFQMYYPDSECELKVDKEEAQSRKDFLNQFGDKNALNLSFQKNISITYNSG